MMSMMGSFIAYLYLFKFKSLVFQEDQIRCVHFGSFGEDFIHLKRSGYCICSSESDAVVVANDEKYGLKAVISITPRLYDYILFNVREPEVLRELREETAGMQGSHMQVSPEQAQLFVMLVQTLGTQRCIEVGVFTGYPSLAIALVLPESGCLVACERDGRCLEIAKKYYGRAGVAHKNIRWFCPGHGLKL